MTTDSAITGYSHTQKAPLCVILYGMALTFFAIAWLLLSAPGDFIIAAVALLIGTLAPAFHHLTVEDQGDRLAIRFGPLPLFRRIVQYADIEKAEIGRTPLLDGWGGIHYSLRAGWVWTLWGRDCVVLHLKKGVLRIGTDDAPDLARFIEFKLTQQGK